MPLPLGFELNKRKSLGQHTFNPITMKASMVRRRWRRPVAKVMALVLLSLLVPLFLLIHNHFYGYQKDDRSLSGLRVGDRDSDEMGSGYKRNVSVDSTSNITMPVRVADSVPVESNSSETSDTTELQKLGKEARSSPPMRARSSGKSFNNKPVESKQACQDEFGSYCLWSVEHKVEMDDVLISKLKDQLFIARAYYPSIIKVKSEEKLSCTMRLNIQEHERILSVSATDADLPSNASKMIKKMELTITRARLVHVDCNNVHAKLRQILDLSEDEAHFHTRQSAFLYQLGVHTMPKSLHCLLMRLTTEYFSYPPVSTKGMLGPEFQLEKPSFQHYVIFSRNVLASSVTINSTVMNSKVSENLIFYIVTDRQNYYAMRFWFSVNSFKESVVNIINLEDYEIHDSYKLALESHPTFSEEFRITIRSSNHPSSTPSSTEYISVFGHVQFILPVVFRNIKKVVVLDEDVVVQRDLSLLWNLDLDGKVNGAMHFCSVRLGQLKSYFGGHKYAEDLCVWISGLNIIDLEMWREYNVTATYEMYLETLQKEANISWREALMPANYLAFQNLTYPIDKSLVLSDLGNRYGINSDQIRNAAVLHYNGDMKPWLDLGIRRYKKYWKKFLLKGNLFLDQCNVNL